MLQPYYKEFTLQLALMWTSCLSIVHLSWLRLILTMPFEKYFFIRIFVSKMPLSVIRLLLKSVNITWFDSHQYLKESSSLGYPEFLLRNIPKLFQEEKQLTEKQSFLFVPVFPSHLCKRWFYFEVGLRISFPLSISLGNL